jgi:glycosyltransferase involved in cell wall biosynthesis
MTNDLSQEAQPRHIAVIVTTFNRPDALSAVLKGLRIQTDQLFEVIVADDGSGDETRQAIELERTKFPVKLSHIWHPDEGFRAAAIRNKGILATEADYLIFLDGDCIPQPDFVARHRALALGGRLITGSRIMLGKKFTAELLDNEIDVFSIRAGKLLSERLRGEVNKVLPLWIKFPMGQWRHINRFVWRRIKSCNLSAWRKDILSVNGFDESFVGWGHEDADFVLRLFNAGIQRTDGAYATEILHLWHPDAKRDSERGNYKTVQKRMETGQIRALVGLDQRISRAL